MDETGTKTQYAKTFLYGLKSAHANQSKQCGLGEHVTIGVTANLESKFLDPTFLFTVHWRSVVACRNDSTD